MTRRVAIIILIIVWYCIVRNYATLPFVQEVTGHRADGEWFLLVWSWFGAIPVTGLSIVVPVGVIQFIRGNYDRAD